MMPGTLQSCSEGATGQFGCLLSRLVRLQCSSTKEIAHASTTADKQCRLNKLSCPVQAMSHTRDRVRQHRQVTPLASTIYDWSKLHSYFVDAVALLFRHCDRPERALGQSARSSHWRQVCSRLKSVILQCNDVVGASEHRGAVPAQPLKQLLDCVRRQQYTHQPLALRSCSSKSLIRSSGRGLC